MSTLNVTARRRRKLRIRKKIQGTAERPRLAICRSNCHIYAQLVDDSEGKTLVAASTLSPELADHRRQGGTVSAAVEVGKLIAAKAKACDVQRVVFDRGGYLYHGRVKAIAEAAREAGLKF
jgi:large subunit ribosomal protein L18